VGTGTAEERRLLGDTTYESAAFVVLETPRLTYLRNPGDAVLIPDPLSQNHKIMAKKPAIAKGFAPRNTIHSERAQAEPPKRGYRGGGQSSFGTDPSGPQRKKPRIQTPEDGYNVSHRDPYNMVHESRSEQEIHTISDDESQAFISPTTRHVGQPVRRTKSRSLAILGAVSAPSEFRRTEDLVRPGRYPNPNQEFSIRGASKELEYQHPSNSSKAPKTLVSVEIKNPPSNGFHIFDNMQDEESPTSKQQLITSRFTSRKQVGNIVPVPNRSTTPQDHPRSIPHLPPPDSKSENVRHRESDIVDDDYDELSRDASNDTLNETATRRSLKRQCLGLTRSEQSNGDIPPSKIKVNVKLQPFISKKMSPAQKAYEGSQSVSWFQTNGREDRLDTKKLTVRFGKRMEAGEFIELSTTTGLVFGEIPKGQVNEALWAEDSPNVRLVGPRDNKLGTNHFWHLGLGHRKAVRWFINKLEQHWGATVRSRQVKYVFDAALVIEL
jgi:hypothetical protein